MDADVKDLKDRTEALEGVVISLAALLTGKDVVTRPEMFRMLVSVMRQMDAITVQDIENENRSDSEYRPTTPIGRAVEVLKTDFMDIT